jgi:Protein of unknown function (DUF1214)
MKDEQGRFLDGGNDYRLTVPANVPVNQYWSAVVYDRATHTFIRDVSRLGLSSQTPGLQKNADGSVDIYFGPKAPAGKESNWIPTRADGQFEVGFRFLWSREATVRQDVEAAGYRETEMNQDEGVQHAKRGTALIAPRSLSIRTRQRALEISVGVDPVQGEFLWGGPSAAFASSNQKLMPILRYIVIAVAKCSSPCARSPMRWWSEPRPRWQWAMSGRMPSSVARARASR